MSIVCNDDIFFAIVAEGQSRGGEEREEGVNEGKGKKFGCLGVAAEKRREGEQEGPTLSNMETRA